MAIVLYKSGGSYKSPKGILCQFQICNEFSYLHLLDDGWFYTPEEIEEVKALKKELIKEKVKATEKEPKDEKFEASTSKFDINSLYEDSEDVE